MTHGGTLAAKALKAAGVECVFTLSGGHVMAIYDGCIDEGIDVIDVRHEQAAVHAADAWARLNPGKVGVAIDSLADMRVLLAEIPLGDVTTSMTINATAAALLLLYQLVAEEQGVETSAIRGTVQNDILKEYIARGTYIYPVGPSMRLVTDIFAYCAAELPKWNTISISGYHIREAGSTAAQEVAFTIANGLAYVEAEEVTARISRLRDKLIAGVLERIPDSQLSGHPNQRLPNSASFLFKYIEGESILLSLDQMGVAASSGSACMFFPRRSYTQPRSRMQTRVL